MKKKLFRAKDHPNLISPDDDKPQYVSTYSMRNVDMKNRKKRGVK